MQFLNLKYCLIIVWAFMFSCESEKEQLKERNQVTKELSVFEQYEADMHHRRKRNNEKVQRNKEKSDLLQLQKEEKELDTYTLRFDRLALLKGGKVLVFKSYVDGKSYFDNKDSLYINPVNVKSLKVYNLHFEDEEDEFPDILFLFTNIESLWFQNTNMEKLSSKITAFKKIEKLFFKGSHLKELPDNFHELEYLEELFFVETYMTKLNPSVTQLPRLKRLVFGYSGLKELPKGIRKMKSLEFFDLGGNLRNEDESLILECMELEKKMPNCAIFY